MDRDAGRPAPVPAPVRDVDPLAGRQEREHGGGARVAEGGVLADRQQRRVLESERREDGVSDCVDAAVDGVEAARLEPPLDLARGQTRIEENVPSHQASVRRGEPSDPVVNVDRCTLSPAGSTFTTTVVVNVDPAAEIVSGSTLCPHRASIPRPRANPPARGALRHTPGALPSLGAQLRASAPPEPGSGHPAR